MNEYRQKLATAGIHLVDQSVKDRMTVSSELTAREPLKIIELGNVGDAEASSGRNSGCKRPPSPK